MSPRTLVARQTTSASDGAGTSASATRTRTRASASPAASASATSANAASNSPTPSAGLPPASSASGSNGGGEVPINVIVGGTLAGMALAIAIIMAWAYFSRALKRRRELESKKAHWLEETKNNTLHNIAPNTPLSMRGAGSLQPVSVSAKPSTSRVTFTGRGRKNSSGTNNFNGGGDLAKGHLHQQQQRPPGITPSQLQSTPSASIPSASIPPTSKPQPSLPKPLKPLRPPKRINPDAYGYESGSGPGSPAPSFESRDTTRPLLQRDATRVEGERWGERRGERERGERERGAERGERERGAERVERERERDLMHMPSTVSSASWYSTESAEEHLARPPASLIRAAFTRMGVGVDAAMGRSASYVSVGEKGERGEKGEQRGSRGSRHLREAGVGVGVGVGVDGQPSRVSQATTTSAYSQTGEGVAL